MHQALLSLDRHFSEFVFDLAMVTDAIVSSRLCWAFLGAISAGSL